MFFFILKDTLISCNLISVCVYVCVCVCPYVCVEKSGSMGITLESTVLVFIEIASDDMQEKNVIYCATKVIQGNKK